MTRSRLLADILGHDTDERVETLVRLLRGTSEEDLTLLIGDVQEALMRLTAAHTSRVIDRGP